MLGEDVAHLFEEIFAAVQPGQAVEHELIDHRGGLAQLDEAGGAVEDDARAVGLGHIVGRAVGEGDELVLLVVALRGHDDGDAREHVVVADAVEEGVAVHDGHHHVQQDEGDVVPVRLQHVERLLPVFGLEHAVLRGEDFAQNLPVERVVFNDENLSLHGGHTPLCSGGPEKSGGYCPCGLEEERYSRMAVTVCV